MVLLETQLKGIMKVGTNEQIKLLAEFFKTLTFTNKTGAIQGLLNLQVRGFVSQRDIIVDKWPDPDNILIKCFRKQAEHRKTRNTLLMWSCDPKSATPLLKNEIDWSQEWRFDVLVEDYLPLLEDLSVSFGGVLHSVPGAYEAQIMLNRPDNDKFGSLPDHFQMSSLGTSDAAFIDSWYKFADEFSHRESLYEIEHLPNVAIRNSQGDLAAWGVIQVDSTIGKLHTMPQYRKKGLGRFVSWKLAEEAHNIGLIPLAYVDVSNQASKDMFTSAGYGKLNGLIWWKIYTPPTATI